MAKIALGRGLGSLIQQPRSTETSTSPKAKEVLASTPTPIKPDGERVQTVALSDIVPSPLQPRKEFRPEQLSELIDSIRERGIIQPLIVRPVDGKWELIAGERRSRAATAAGLSEVPVIVREASDQEVLELALIENLQRADLNAIDEARGYKRLIADFGLTQEGVAQKVGRNRTTVANALRLLDLHEQVQEWLVQRRLSVGHVKVLLAVKNPADQRALAELVIRENASVRNTEKLVQQHLAGEAIKIASDAGSNVKVGGPGSRSASAKSSTAGSGASAAVREVENSLRQHLSTQVKIHEGEKKGTVEIEFYGVSDLNRIVQAMGLKDSFSEI